MKIAAVDLGDVRTGLAFSDLTGFIAGRAVTLTANSRAELVEKICAELKTERAEKVVVGLPLNMDGSEGDRALKAKSFAEILRDACGLPVVMWDERGTSVTANRLLSDAGKKRGKQRQKVDAVAASIILQSFLDANPR